MIDVNKQIKIAVKTGKIDFGCEEAVDAARAGKAKLVILASNCPENYRKKILFNAELSQIPVYAYSGTSLDLATACEKLFVVAAVTVKEPGDSDILKLAETGNVSA